MKVNFKVSYALIDRAEQCPNSCDSSSPLNK